MHFSGGKTGFLLKPRKERRKKTKNNKTKKNKNKEGLGPSEVARKPPKKTKKGEKKGKHQQRQRKNFSVVSQYFPFLVGVQNFPLFDTLAQKARTQKTLYKGVSTRFLLKNRYASRNGHFWTKNQNQKFQLSFFLPFSSLSTTKNTTFC